MGQHVGINLHRRSTTIVRMAEDGEVLGTERFVSQPFELAQAMAAAGPEPEVVLESTYGWYWAVDLLQDLGAHVHLAHALGNNWGNGASRTTCATPRTWPPCWPSGVWPRAGSRQLRGLRELVRYRYSLIRHRTSAKSQIHGEMAKNGIPPVVRELWGPTGQVQLDRPELPEAYAVRLDSLRNLLEVYEAAIAELDTHIHAQLKADPRYQALLTLPGVGKVIAAIWWPRSAASAASTRPRSSAAGPASPPSTASPTRWSTAGRSPSRAHPSCAGRPSRLSATAGPRATRSSAPTTHASPSTPASTRLGSPSPASS
jgi:hypothetical protein